MFKHNYLQKLAFDNIRKSKSFYKFIFIALLLIFILSSMSSILFSSYQAIGFKEKYSRYGLWSAAVPYSYYDELKKIAVDFPDLEFGSLYEIGKVTYQDKQIGDLKSLDQKAFDLAKLSLIEGRLPYRSHEIVLEEDQFLLLNLPKRIHQNIELTVSMQGKKIVKKYEIVGIIENYSQIYEVDLGGILTTQITSQNGFVFLYNQQDNLHLWNVLGEHQNEIPSLLNTSTYSDYHLFSINNYPQYKMSEYTDVMNIFLIALGFFGVLGTMVSSVRKRTKYFTLMKAIGATSKQIQKMIVYEGVYLIVIAGIIGTVCGIILSLSILYLYCNDMNSDFLCVLNSLFYIQLIMTVVASFLGVFLPSLEAYFVPLIQRITQKLKVKKRSQIRKMNIFSLSLQEVTNHKMMLFLLVVLILGGILASDLASLSIEGYLSAMDRLNRDDNYDYIISVDNGDVLSPKDTHSLTDINGIYSQVLYQNDIYITWDGIDQLKEARAFRKQGFTYKGENPYIESAVVSYYENQNALRDVIEKYDLKGQMPKQENEVLIIKPRMMFYDHGFSYSLNKNDNQSYYDVGLERGDFIDVFISQQDSMELKKIPQSLKIVGILYFDDISVKDERLFEVNYNLITTKETYQNFYQNGTRQNFFIDINKEESILTFKKQLFSLKSQYPLLSYTDVNNQLQLDLITSLEGVLKDVSFFGILFVGIMTLVYLQRMIRLLGMKHEIGLYRAIGLTHKQTYMIHFFYGFFIMIFAVAIYVIMWIANVMSSMDESFVETLKMIIYSPRLSFVLLINLVFILVIMLPVHRILKENLLETISQE